MKRLSYMYILLSKATEPMTTHLTLLTCIKYLSYWFLSSRVSETCSTNVLMLWKVKIKRPNHRFGHKEFAHLHWHWHCGSLDFLITSTILSWWRCGFIKLVKRLNMLVHCDFWYNLKILACWHNLKPTGQIEIVPQSWSHFHKTVWVVGEMAK